MDTRKVSQMGLLIALALVLSYIEAQIPTFVAIPGIKVGLANIVVVFALYRLGFKEAAAISFLRVLLASLLFGSVLSLAYSFAGALLSLLGMVFLERTKLFGSVAVSVVGGVLHNVGQILTACIVLDTNVVVYYLPFLILSGTIAGVVVGLVAALVLKRLGGFGVPNGDETRETVGEKANDKASGKANDKLSGKECGKDGGEGRPKR